MGPVIRVANLEQKIGRKLLFQGISFEVHSGECWGIFGTRGAGKTSLVHILAGVDRFKSGQVEILGFNIKKTEKFKGSLGLVTQENSLFRDMTVLENLDFIAALKNASRATVLELIERFQLSEFLKKPVTSLDIGVLQRVSLACALLNQPKLLILDEIIKDIDLFSRNLILKELEQFLAEGGTCVSTFSSFAFAQSFSKVAWLEGGEITLYNSEAAQAEWNRLEKYYAEQSGRLL
ncbi:ABC-type multidrug transport system, ATPase component [Desulfosporosinus orientis DSM 765]|uniref:ABC-type multidrug transport system, ATPase component n=1 Tax=Desulfosporosinus orientis (strain ATCC 19365 / DSM 765 / NCIMB 8382 / VKM B-1628 / Singapore I) TaxID=768706 RepID=G7W8D6_DESOD|nr:ABC transporter ATP-binding protein [Desulfosporosinus orientis]AET67076.1 ABC-type multidrug transport system, ATPase component [Desulfosporosinus orientis DSM 765]